MSNRTLYSDGSGAVPVPASGILVDLPSPGGGQLRGILELTHGRCANSHPLVTVPLWTLLTGQLRYKNTAPVGERRRGSKSILGLHIHPSIHPSRNQVRHHPSCCSSASSASLRCSWSPRWHQRSSLLVTRRVYVHPSHDTSEPVILKLWIGLHQPFPSLHDLPWYCEQVCERCRMRRQYARHLYL